MSQTCSLSLTAWSLSPRTHIRTRCSSSSTCNSFVPLKGDERQRWENVQRHIGLLPSLHTGKETVSNKTERWRLIPKGCPLASMCACLHPHTQLSIHTHIFIYYRHTHTPKKETSQTTSLKIINGILYIGPLPRVELTDWNLHCKTWGRESQVNMKASDITWYHSKLDKHCM